LSCFFFFFQAEDGIRDFHVTGVQTCALPIYELYQMISIDPQSHPLLKAKSPQDSREHIVGWTYQFGRGRVFATTLGHDMKTAGSPDYLQLLANGLLWTCNKLGDDGKAVAGYAGKGTP